MARVGHGVGLSVERHGGKWLLRWRQDEVQPDGTVARVQRNRTAFTIEEMRSLTAEIESALRERGWWRPSSERPAMPMIANAERAAADWIGWKVGTRGVKANTRVNLAHSMRRFFTELRVIARLKETDPVPVTLLTAANVNAVTTRLRDRYGQGTVYQTIAAVVDMWGWVADDPEKYAEVPRPPFSKARVLPQRAIYEAPEDVATWAETDACVRRIRRPIPRRLATIMRYTGLRLEQAAHVYREDFDLEHATLLVRKGKSQREQAQMRRVPVSRHLIEDLGDWLVDHQAGPLFPDSKAVDDQGKPLPLRSYRNQTVYVTEAWKAATLANEARREVWAPPSRKKTRPDHAFRAALQGALDAAGFSESIVDALVGHAPKSTRGRHYARPAENVMREAVDSIPPIDWEALDNVVAFPKRAAVGASPVPTEAAGTDPRGRRR